jgi:aminoglycoside phosphotransferase (APT) family kinase protein
MQHLPNFSTLHSDHPLRISQFTHGQSNPTFLLSLGAAAFVLRKQPKGRLLPSAHQIQREFAVMQALHGSLVPVPRVHCLCEDSGVIGQPFYVMQYVKGRIFKQAELPGLTREARFAVYSAMNTVLAALHAVDVKQVGLLAFGPRSGYAQRNVSRWSRQYEASKTEEIVSMDKLTAWLRCRMQQAEDAAGSVCIVHGDFRLDNLVFHPTQNRIIAVLVRRQAAAVC